MSSRYLVLFAVLAVALLGAFAWYVGDARARTIEPTAPLVTGSVASAEPAVLEVADPGRATALASATERDARAPARPDPLLVRVVDTHGVSFPDWTVDVAAFEELTTQADIERAAYFGGRAAYSGTLSPPDFVLRGKGDEYVEVPAERRARGETLVFRGQASPRDDDLDQERGRAVGSSTRGPIELVVQRFARLVVRVDGPLPVGVVEFQITPAVLTSIVAARPLTPDTVTVDTATFRVEDAVAYRLRVSGEQATEVLEVDIPPLARGERRVVPVTFAACTVEPDRRELALAGRVESEDGDLPGLWATVDGHEPRTIPIHPDGTFEFLHERGEKVELHAAGEDFEARTQPEVSTHAFGTRDVVLRRRPRAARSTVRLEIVAAETGAPLTGAHVGFVHREGALVHAHELGPWSSARIDIPMPALADLEYLVRAAGRRDARASVYGGVVPGAGGEHAHVVRLERGFRREFRIVDCKRGTPIAGATVELEDAGIATSDADGRALVELDVWPARLAFRAPGHEEARWPRPGLSGVQDVEIALCPEK